MCGSGCRASSELTATSAPRASRSMASKARAGLIWLKSLSSYSARQSSSVVSAKVLCRPWPALFTRRSQPPKRSRTFAAKAPTASASSTSSGWARTRSVPKSRASTAAASSSRPAWRAQSATRAPLSSSTRTVAKPIPDEPPVTTAVSPA